MHRQGKGTILVAVIIVAVIFAIIGLGILTIGEHEAILGRIDSNKTKAFYLAEGGLAKLSETLQVPVALGDIDDPIEGSTEQGSFRVVLDTSSSPYYAISTGTAGTVQRRIRVRANFLANPFENAIYAMNSLGGTWALQLRGTGNPVASGGKEVGGKDILNGNIIVDGDVYMYEESRVNAAPAPNTYGLNGDVGATGGINVLGSASISGSRNPNSDEPDPINVVAMDYANNNTHNVAQIFQSAGVSSGYLPSGNPLRDVFVKNPSDRNDECATTTGNDYFFEPSTGIVLGTEKTAATPLHAGTDRVYYVDGDVWVHSKGTYGFNMDGKVTIVATGNIHISDNIAYANTNSLLGLVALGKYDGSGNRISGGDIFFGDPRYGTMYTVSGLMFAANDFMFNTDAITRKSSEPTTGFQVNGSFAAMGRVTVNREWYDKNIAPTGCRAANATCTSNSQCCSGKCSMGKCGTGTQIEVRAAEYNPTTGQWFDEETGTALIQTEINSIRHYQMIVNYDENVRNPETCPPGLPRGGKKIFAGFSNWQEL